MGCLNSLTQSCLMSVLRRAHISNLFRGMWDYCWFMRLLGLWFTVDLVTTDSGIDTFFSLYFRHSLAPSFTPFFYLVTNSYLNVYMTYIQKHGSGMVKKKKGLWEVEGKIRVPAALIMQTLTHPLTPSVRSSGLALPRASRQTILGEADHHSLRC